MENREGLGTSAVSPSPSPSKMLVSREELRFDPKGGKFDLGSEADRKLLAWVFDQFLYGEVTGIQCGHWLYRAPHLNAATFLAKQASEELSHVRKILRIFSLLGEKPSPAHWAVRFLSTGMMGGSWGEHVALEMALGEGLVLGVFYLLTDTMPEGEIRKILEGASLEEERHVEFGERETRAWLEANPASRAHLLSLALVQLWAMRHIKRFVMKKLMKSAGAAHPVLSQFGAFYDHSLRCFRLRIERLGLSGRPLDRIPLGEKLGLLAMLPLRQLRAHVPGLRRKQPLLTSSYLRDPAVAAESERFRLS